MTFDAHRDFAFSTVATAPSPAGSGLSLTVASGEGSRFPDPATEGPYNVVVWATGQSPIWASGGNTGGNFEVLRVTARSTDTLTIARAQDGSTARTILVGDQVALVDLAKLWQDIERSSPVVMPQGRFWKQSISPGAPTFPTVTSPVVTGASSNYNAFPWVTANKFGTLVMVYRHGTAHVSDQGAVMMRTSADGVTWSSATAITSPAAGHDHRDPSIVCTQTGRLIVNFFDYNGSAVIGLDSIFSDDGGATWSSPASHTVYSSYTATSGAILQHSSGALIWPVYGQNSGDTADRCGVLVSWDDGITWGAVTNISAASSAYTEMTLVEFADRSVHAFIRNDVNNFIFTASSTDIGATWSSITSLGWSVTNGRPAAILVPASQALILFYRKTSTFASVYRYSLDYGASWSAEQTYTGSVYEYAGGFAIAEDLIGVAVAYENGTGGAAIDFATMAVTKRLQTLTAGSGITLTPASNGADTTISASGAVSSVFTRTGAVVAVTGDYYGVVAAALTGATQTSRYVGATTSGAPASGTFATGDFVIARDGHLFVCTSGGTPGTWVDAGSSGAVSSVFGRTGTVVAGNADYLAVASGGLTGATSASRYVGGTTSGAPASGTFSTGDFVIARDGHIFICTSGGTPGTWADAGSASGVSSIAKNGSTGLTGAVTLTGGSNVTLTQSGNDISIASTGGGGTTEYDYVENATGTITVTSTSDGNSGGQAFIDGNAVTYDGSTRVMIEFGVYAFDITTNDDLLFNLYDGTTDLGRMWNSGTASTANLTSGAHQKRFLTPSTGSHTYHIRVWKTGGTAHVYTGTGGASTAMPGWYRITKA